MALCRGIKGRRPVRRLARLALAAGLVMLAALPAAAESGQDEVRHRQMPDYDPMAGDTGTSVDEGRDAVMATLGKMLGRFYDGAKNRLGLDGDGGAPGKPPPAAGTLETLTLGTVAVRGLSLKADPRRHSSRGLAADTDISVLGLDSQVGLQLGTETVGQSLSVRGSCDAVWLPNDVTGSFSADHDDRGVGVWTGELRSSWGTACAPGQEGWRVTAGLRDLGAERVRTLGLEYRPAPFTPLAGLSSLRAGLDGERGEVGAELSMGELRGQPMRLDASVNWQDDGQGALRLGTRLRF